MVKKSFIFYIALLCCLCSGMVLADANYQVKITGITGSLLTNVNSRLATETSTLGDQLTPSQLQRFSESLPHIIKLAMEPYGYFKPSITSHLNKRVITVAINKGQPVIITELQIKAHGPGKDNQELKNYLQHLPMTKGERFRVDTYETIKDGLFKIANDQGYIKAYLEENKIYINRETRQVSIVWNLHTGQQYFFGNVAIDSGPFAESFVRRFININSRMPFSTDKLSTLQQAMVNSYYFDQVTITPHLNQSKNQQVPISINVTAPKSQKYTLGIGYGTFTGVRLTAGLTLRRIGNNGEHLTSQLKLSQVTSGLAVKYYIPGRDPLTDQWVVGANYQRFRPRNGASNSATLSGGYARHIGNWQLNSNLNYLVDRYTLFNMKTSAVIENHFSKLLYPNFNVAFTQSDDVINPSYGYYGMFNVQGASKAVLSSLNFIQAEAKAKVLLSPTTASKLLFRADLGYTVTDDIKQLPLSMRFFAGGLNSVRGYSDSSLGPGRYLAVASVEYQHHVYGNWDGAIFYDVGNAMDNWSDRLMRGQGVGVIYRSMIGPIKLYVGQAVNKEGKPHSIEFSIGPEF